MFMGMAIPISAYFGCHVISTRWMFPGGDLECYIQVRDKNIDRCLGWMIVIKEKTA
jgi:hypothetical protein